MKVPLKWLEDFVTIEVPVSELAERLTFAGLEVEDVTEVGGDWDRERQDWTPKGADGRVSANGANKRWKPMPGSSGSRP